MEPTGPRWNQFRRLLLGTIVELVQHAGVPFSLADVALIFHADSRFEVPRFDNHMRFVGQVRLGVASPPTEEALARLRQSLAQVWPEILGVVDIPIGDGLTSTRNDTSAEVEGDRLVVRFDLVAD